MDDFHGHRFGALLDSLPGLFFVFGEDGTFELWNDAVPATTGYSERELAEMTPTAFVDAEDADRVAAAIADLHETGATTVEADLVTASGERIPYEFTVRRLPDDGPVAFAGLGRDITARRAAEKRRTAILDRMGDGFFAVDTDWRITYANEAGRRLLARAMDRPLEGTTFEGLHLWDEIPDAVETTFYDEYQRAMATGEAISFEEHFAPLDAWFDVRAFPSETGLSIHFREITDQRQSRDQLEHRERVLKELHAITADRDASFTDQVESLLALGRTELDTEYGSLSEIAGEDYRFEVVVADDDSLQAGDVVPLAATNCELVAARTETIAWGDIAADAPGQTDRAGYTEWGISCYLGAPVYDNDGVYGTFCFYGSDTRADQFSDWEVTLVDLMSRWVSYELQRKQVTEELQRQNERLERFASIVSHDLRNPLNVLSGGLEFAEETGDPAEFARCYEAIDRMRTLIDDLLTLSRAGAAIDDVDRVEFAEVAELAWESVATDGATLQLDAPITVSADSSRLQQLLENLFRNSVEHGSTSPERAADATAPDGGAVAVTVGALEHGFYVEDDGPGIPADHRETVFESHYSAASDGTGLGLAIVADIAEAHGWEIRATEGTDGGARFEVTGIDTS